MVIAFAFVLPISMALFYFGTACNISYEVRKRVHYTGFVATSVLCALGIVFEVALNKESPGLTWSLHSTNGAILYITMLVSMLLFVGMRRLKYRLQIWCDFILCFLLLSWSFSLIIGGFALLVDSWMFASVGWFCLVIATFIALSLYLYLTQGTTQWIIIAKGDDEMFEAEATVMDMME